MCLLSERRLLPFDPRSDASSVLVEVSGVVGEEWVVNDVVAGWRREIVWGTKASWRVVMLRRGKVSCPARRVLTVTTFPLSQSQNTGIRVSWVKSPGCRKHKKQTVIIHTYPG